MKPFKNTKLGEWLKTNAPKALDFVGDVLPDKGVLGILKNIIGSSTDIPAEQKLEFERLLADHEKKCMPWKFRIGIVPEDAKQNLQRLPAILITWCGSCLFL
jgi:hypothetical protein